MRILMWFTIGFAAACALSAYLGIGIWLCLLTVPIAIVLFVLKKTAAKIGAVLLVGVAVGMLWTAGYNYFYLNAARNYDGEKIVADATVSDYSYQTDYGVAVEGRTMLDGKTFRIKLYYPVDTALEPGDRIQGEIRFRLTTNDSRQGATHHQGDGIFLLAYVDEKAVVQKAENTHWRFFGAYLRREISQLLKAAFPEDTLAFATALLLGDTSLLDYETDTDFKISGIRHVIAISGLHVSILMSVVYVFSGRRRYLSALIGVPVLFVFAAVVGFTPSVVRACVMQGLMLLALFFNKEYDPPTALAFAVLSMLCVNPMQITSASFQLSCGCLVGIFLFYERIDQYLLKVLKAPKGKGFKADIIRWFSGSVSITLSTMITTTPLSAAYFGTVSVVGVLTNLLTLWVVAFVFCAVALACVMALIWLPGARLIAWVASVPIRYVMIVAKLLADLPFSAVYTCSIYIVIWLVMCYLLLTVFLLSKRKCPWLLAGCVAFGLILAIGLSWIEPGYQNYRVTVFDVGQGQSILFECDNKRYLVDCGGDSNRTAAETVSHSLLSRGITRLDGIFVTHFDDDHAGGVPLLLTSIDTDVLYLPQVEDNGTVRSDLEKGDQKIHWIDRYAELELGSMKFTMIPGEHETNDNERSMCILFQTGNCDILITGDRSGVGEKALLEDIHLPKLELLVVGHHGSKSATSMELLHATTPKTAVISVGKDNYYGHPTEDVLYRLRLFSCSIWRTDLDGTVVFEG